MKLKELAIYEVSDEYKAGHNYSGTKRIKNKILFA
jgi:hypothetical protein